PKGCLLGRRNPSGTAPPLEERSGRGSRPSRTRSKERRAWQFSFPDAIAQQKTPERSRHPRSHHSVYALIGHTPEACGELHRLSLTEGYFNMPEPWPAERPCFGLLVTCHSSLVTRHLSVLLRPGAAVILHS